MRTLIVLLCAYLTGCAVAPSKLEPPAAALMAPPPKLSDPKEGDDAILLLIETRKKYVAVAERHRRLQRYVRTVMGE